MRFFPYLVLALYLVIIAAIIYSLWFLAETLKFGC